ncbi:MAG: DUF2231 domain-containing protein [Calditrichaeota bacterium]|nr:MAG: DUF2231 domain-containing protein [Calditrichota bacterium]
MEILQGLTLLQNIHPLFVHFPIALVLVVLLFEILWQAFKKEEFRSMATWLLYLGALSAVAAVISGVIASNGLGHDSPGHDLVHVHRDIMYWMTGILVITAVAVLFAKPLRNGAQRKWLIIPLLITSALLIYGADKGGVLVFEHGMGVNLKIQNPESFQVETDEEKAKKPARKTHIHRDGKEHKH